MAETMINILFSLIIGVLIFGGARTTAESYGMGKKKAIVFASLAAVVAAIGWCIISNSPGDPADGHGWY